MLMKDRLKKLLPELARIKRVAEEGESLYWEIYDEGGALIGYGAYADVPETPPDIEDVEEFDKYAVTAIVSTDYRVQAIDIGEHPDGPETLWSEDIIAGPYANQYIGMSKDDIKLAPEGKIDSITDATLSARMVTDAIRSKVEIIMERTS